MKNKKGVIISVVLIIVFTVIGGLAGWFGKDYLVKEKKVETTNKVVKEENTNTKEWKDIALDDSKFYSLYTNLKEFTYDKSRAAGADDFSDLELEYLGFGIADVKESDFNIIDKSDEYNIKASFNSDIIKKGLDEMFNSDINLDYNKLGSVNFYTLNTKYNLDTKNYPNGCGANFESYDSNTKTVTAKFTSGCGGTSGPTPSITERKIVSAKENGDTIVVEEKAIYYDLYYNGDNINCTVYGDNSKIKYLKSLVFNVNNLTNESINVDSYLDNASTITHTYKLNKDTNKYYFVGSKIN